MQKRGKTQNKAQAAMEFLMTNGWAIMVVMIAIGSLAYFGVLSPDKFLPRRCALEPGIGCMDFKVQEDSVTLVLRNGKGEDITLSEIAVGECKGMNLGSLKNGEQRTFTITGCTNSISEKFYEKINLTYTSETGLEHKNIGSIADKVESGRILSPGAYEWITTTTTEFDEGTYSQTESASEQDESVKISSGSSGTYTSKIFDAGKIAAWTILSWGEPVPYKEHIAPDGCGNIKGLWYLDESSGTAIDSSGCGKNGNNAGATQGADGKINNAYEFDGLNDYVDIGASLFPPLTQQVTAMAWAKTMETNSPQNGEGHLIFYHGWDGEFNFGQGDDDTFFYCYDYIIPPNNPVHWWDCVVSTIKAAKGSWYHIAVTWDSVNDKAQLFINGNLAGEKPLQPEWELHDSMTYHPATIGAYTVWSGARTTLWNGSIDEIVVYSRTLLSSEILDIYKRGVLNLFVEMRSCDDSNCNGEEWSSQIFTDAANNALSVPDNRYFQYKVTFEADDADETPYLQDVTVGYTIT